MCSSESCAHCGRSLVLVADDAIRRERISHGFGAANNELRSYCGLRCRALGNDRDAVLETTQQSTLALFYDGVDRHDPAAVVWNI
ncbi:hypothetical protein C489_03336 [Natrinema versiforme JCM 10478]|uniref:Uncharacterized protein n=1 Tax=Natrinema versiforme JCM 10478 TaxID=1227496 RepID=L9YAK5_9EURY|nr:hypothetical protein C489_03336 [Natrinema versiforme JCM 10478]